MATEIQSYPALSNSTWWKLRKKFNSSIPREVSPSYLASALDMSEASAKANVLSKLKLIEFIDSDNKPTELAVRWRDDSEYTGVCKELLEKLYPSELQDAIDDPLNNKDRVVKWFQNKTRVGEAAAKMMATFYFLLVEADVSKQNATTQSKTEKTNKAAPKKEKAIGERAASTPKAKSEEIKRGTDKNEDAYSSHQKRLKNMPQVTFNIQIVLPENASPETYEAIFSSMSTHLLGRDEE